MNGRCDLQGYLNGDSPKIAFLNQEAIQRFAEYLSLLPEPEEYFNFFSIKRADRSQIIMSDMYPPLGHPEVVNFFFYVCSQQFGFWYGDSHGYVEPLYGTLDGRQYKGSDLLWRLAMRAFNRDQNFFQPEKLASLTPLQFADFMSDDNGPIAFPNWEARYCLTTGFGRNFRLHERRSPLEMVAKVNADQSKYQIDSFCDDLSDALGFGGDYLNKKSLLLAMVLANRPEKLLAISPEVEWNPIIDYHLIRLALRLGLVLVEKSTADILIARNWVSPETEEAVRGEIYNAINQVIRLSGKKMPFVDYLMWQARNYCQEMGAPECSKCKLQDICEKRTGMFQPVFRTTCY